MSGAIETLADERAELARLRNLERGRRKARKTAERRWREDLRSVAAATRERHRRCKCSFRGIKSRDELIAMDGCCDPMFVCPRLDAVRRRMGL